MGREKMADIELKLQTLLADPERFLRWDDEFKEDVAREIVKRDDWAKYVAPWVYFEPKLINLPGVLIQKMTENHFFKVLKFPTYGSEGVRLAASMGKTLENYNGLSIAYWVDMKNVAIDTTGRDYLWGNARIVHNINGIPTVWFQSTYEPPKEEKKEKCEQLVPVERPAAGDTIFFKSFEEYVDWFKTEGYTYHKINVLMNSTDGLTVHFEKKILSEYHLLKSPTLSQEKLWQLERKRLPVDIIPDLELNGRILDALGGIGSLEDLFKAMIKENKVLSVSSSYTIWKKFPDMWRKSPYEKLFKMNIDEKSCEWLLTIDDEQFIEVILEGKSPAYRMSIVNKALKAKNSVFLKHYLRNTNSCLEIGLFQVMYHNKMMEVLPEVFDKLKTEKNIAITFLLGQGSPLATEFLSKIEYIGTSEIISAKLLQADAFLKEAGKLKEKMTPRALEIYTME
jgi:hypothetical protein